MNLMRSLPKGTVDRFFSDHTEAFVDVGSVLLQAHGWARFWELLCEEARDVLDRVLDARWNACRKCMGRSCSFSDTTGTQATP